MRRVPPVGFPVRARTLLTAATQTKRERRAELEGAAAEALTRYYGRPVLALLDSGTSALRTALDMLGALHVGDPDARLVAIPAYGCIDVPTAVMGAGWRALAYDLDPVTLAPDLESLDRAVEAGARAVIVAHWFGHPVHVALLRARYASHPVHIIEDCAQAVGATLHGRALGSVGDLAVLSLGRGKGMVGTGGGVLLGGESVGAGAVPPSGTTAAEVSRVWPTLLGGLAADALSRPWLYAWPAALPWLHLGEMRFHEPHPVQSMSALSLALIPGALRDVEPAHAARAQLVDTLCPVAQAAGFGVMQPPVDARAGWLRLPLLLPVSRQRDTVPAALGVVRPYTRPLSEQQEVAAIMRNTPLPMPGADTLAARLVTLPVHRFVAPADVAQLRAWLQRG